MSCHICQTSLCNPPQSKNQLRGRQYWKLREGKWGVKLNSGCKCVGNGRQGVKWGDPWGRGLVVQIGVLSRNWQLPTLHSSAFVGRKIHAFCHMCPHSLHRRRTGKQRGHHTERDPLPTNQTPGKQNTSRPLSLTHYVVESSAPLTSDCDPLCLSSPSASFFWPGWPLLPGWGYVHPRAWPTVRVRERV